MNELVSPVDVIATEKPATDRIVNVRLPNKEALWKIFLPATLTATWLCAGLIALSLKRSQLLIGFDGSYMRDLARRQFEWHLPLLSASMDWFQGLGDLFFAANFRLLPAFIVGSFFANVSVAKVAIYEVVLCELSLAIILFALSLGVSRVVSIAAAVVTCLTFLPFGHPTLIYGILALTPQLGSLIAGALLTAAAFLRFGRRNWLADTPFAVIVVLILGWSVLVGITGALLAGPFLLLCAISGIIAASSRYERWCKIGLFVASTLFMLGPAVYLASIILDTAAVVFPAELANDRAAFFFASILFHWQSVGPVGPLLMIFGIAGAVVSTFDRTHRTLRMFAITLLTYLVSRLTFATLIILFDFWRGPAALYFEFFVIPLYAIFAAVFFAHVLNLSCRLAGWALPRGFNAEVGIVVVGIVVVLVLAIEKSAINNFPYPPKSTQLTQILSQETGLRLGSTFRGRTANMIGRSTDRNINWLDLHSIDGALIRATGNEQRLVGLHYFGIPGMFVYTPTITPFFYALTSRLLAKPGDKQARSVVVLREIDPRILAMVGVRFVVTDRIFEGEATLRATFSIEDPFSIENRTLYLYEIAKPNVGDFSPITVNRITTATHILARLADPNFDATREIIADIPGDSDGLLPTRSAHLSFLGASLRLQAESDGRSLLLLPLEFSHCLVATTIEGETPALFRANLVETGVLFFGTGRYNVVASDRALPRSSMPALGPVRRTRATGWRGSKEGHTIN